MTLPTDSFVPRSHHSLVLGTESIHRDEAVFSGMRHLGGATTVVRLEHLVAHLRDAGYQTPRGGSLVDVVTYVCNWFANRPDKCHDGYAIRRVAPDLFMVEPTQ